MANSRKRISELPPLNAASLDTTFVLGISGSTTYKISINNLTSSLDGAFATDLVTATLSNTLDTKLSTSSFNQYTASAINGTISGSSQLTASFDQRYVVSGSITQTTWDNIANKPSGIVSQSTDLSSLNNFTASYFTDSSSFDTKITTEKNRIDAILSASNANSDTFAEVVSLINSVDLTNDSAFATFYTSSNNRITSLENSTGSYLTSLSGAISSSSQLTSSYDTRYALSSSLSSISSSFNSRFNGLVTTGSNTFSGSQIFSGSMTVTSGQVIASTITNNSSSLFLQSGSNLYVQNDGIVEITGSLRVSGLTTFVAGGGDEGGEIQFGIPTTNTTLQNRVTTDIFQNKYRIFEGSNDAKGVYIDLSKAPVGNNGEITYKTSGIVNAGTFVQLDNIKATVTTSGQRGLSLATVSGTFACNIGGNYAGSGVGSGGTSGTATITTSASTSIFGWGFTNQGDISNYIITDTTNSKAYRIIIQIGNSFNNNLVSIERLH